ncbi:hypothetical protein GQ600_5926 [Phytophthora cactorum]|nr:hypothetical protein GQ600_5926 [Phytophthora cactorum]
METCALDSSFLLTGVAVVCRSCPSIGALTHVVLSLDAYLDPSTTWSIPDACRFGSVRLLERIAARMKATRTIAAKGEVTTRIPDWVTTAMQLGYVGVVQWLIRRYPEGRVPSNDVAEAAKNEVAKFLHEFTAPPPDDMFLIDEAARHGDLEMMRWLHSERGDQLTYEGVMKAVDHGYLDASSG